MLRTADEVRRTKPLTWFVGGKRGKNAATLGFVASVLLLAVWFILKQLEERAGLGDSERYVITVSLPVALLGIALLAAGIGAYAGATMRRQARLLMLAERLEGKTESIQSLEQQRHDFRNQLAVVLGFLQLDWKDRAVDYLHSAIRAHSEPRRTPDFNNPIVRIRHDYDAFHAFYGFLIHKSFAALGADVCVTLTLTAEKLPNVPMDVLLRVAGNLFDNAVEAASASSNGQVVVTARSDDQWTLTFWNNGVSIGPEMIHRVCEPGFTSKGGGSDRGWGLPSVQQALAAHGGALEYGSSPRSGTHFTIRIPWSGAAPDGGARHGSGNNGDRRKGGGQAVTTITSGKRR